MDLDEGKSACVAGYVTYYAKYNQICGDFDLDKSFAASVEHLGVYQCSQYCGYQQAKKMPLFFIWIETNKCFCLHDQYVRYSSTCKHKDVVLKLTLLPSASFPGFFHQCLYQLRLPDGVVKKHASKCLENKYFVCRHFGNASI